MTGRGLVPEPWLAGRAGSIAKAQDDDAERLKRLEDQVKKQQEEIEALKKGPDKAVQMGDEFRYQSPDGNLDMRVGGRFQEHYRTVFERPDASRTSPDTFFTTFRLGRPKGALALSEADRRSAESKWTTLDAFRTAVRKTKGP